MMSESQFWTNGQNSDETAKDAPCEIMLFGVRVKVDPLRKSVSMNDLSQYVHVHPATHDSSSNYSNNVDSSVTVVADSGYASANDAIRNRSNGGRERKRGVPWTEDEHKLFLLGLQNVGKGDWRGISRKFVKTRTPTQVASHAQKHFLRRSNLNRRRRRSSLFDITADSVAVISTEEHQVHEDNNIQPKQFSPEISPLSGFPMAVFPATVGPVPSPPSIMNQMETVTFNNCHRFNGGPPVPTLDLSTRGDNYINREHDKDSLSLSLSLSISCDHNNGMDSSAIQSISGFNNGELVMV